MKEFIKRNWVLVLAFALPIIFILVIVLYTYLPSMFLSTKYDFVYASCSESQNYYPYNCGSYMEQRFGVENNKLVLKGQDQVRTYDNSGNLIKTENYSVRLFYHDTKKNESREITKEDAQKYSLNGLLTSPDGVSVSNGYDRNVEVFPFFSGGSSFAYFLTKGRNRSELNLINVNNNRYYDRNDFKLIGWVMPGRNK